jgi:hypothetical protein
VPAMNVAIMPHANSDDQRTEYFMYLRSRSPDGPAARKYRTASGVLQALLTESILRGGVLLDNHTDLGVQRRDNHLRGTARCGRSLNWSGACRKVSPVVDRPERAG